jgi:hypothetical protein
MNVSSVIPVPVPKILFVEVNTRVYRHDRILFLTNIGGSIKIKFLTSWKRGLWFSGVPATGWQWELPNPWCFCYRLLFLKIDSPPSESLHSPPPQLLSLQPIKRMKQGLVLIQTPLPFGKLRHLPASNFLILSQSS